MFNRDKDDLDQGNESYSVHHENDVSQRVSPLSSNPSITLKQIIRNILLLILITILLRTMVLGNQSPISLLSELRLFMYGIFHHRPVTNENTPIFGSLEFDTVESNPINPVRLVIVIILCLSMIIPFLL